MQDGPRKMQQHGSNFRGLTIRLKHSHGASTNVVQPMVNTGSFSNFCQYSECRKRIADSSKHGSQFLVVDIGVLKQMLHAGGLDPSDATIYIFKIFPRIL